MRPILPVLFLAASLLAARAVRAQSDAHAQHAAASTSAAADRLGGQAAFATIAEVVRRLDADPATDWSRVNLEALRAHLVDMDLVTLRASTRLRPIEGGAATEATGDARVAAAARRLALAHARVLDAMPEYEAVATTIPGGVRLTVRAADGDARAVARIRALGFAGLLAVGDHHAAHHLMLAKGEGH